MRYRVEYFDRNSNTWKREYGATFDSLERAQEVYTRWCIELKEELRLVSLIEDDIAFEVLYYRGLRA